MTLPSSNGLLRHNSWPLALFAAAILIRLSLFVLMARYYPERFFANDSFGYDRLALNLSEHGRFSLSDKAPFAPEIKRTPAYPLFLAATYRVFGHHPRIAILLQLLLNSLTCVLVYEAARRMLGPRIARVVGLLAVVDLSFLRYSAVLLSEALFAFLLSVGCACFVWRHTQRQGAWCVAASGVLFGLSALCKPIALYLPVLLFVLVFARSPDRVSLKSDGLFLLSFLITIAPWTIRNYERLGAPLFSTIGAENLLFYNAAFLEANRAKQSIAAVRSALKAEAQAEAEGKTLGVAERHRILKRIAVSKIRSHPLSYLEVTLKGIVFLFFAQREYLFSDDPSPASLGRGYFRRVLLEKNYSRKIEALGEAPDYLFNVPITAYFLLMNVCMVLGVVHSLKARDLGSLLLLVVVGYFAIVTGPLGCSRFRYPIVPHILLLVGYGLGAFGRLCRQRCPNVASVGGSNQRRRVTR